MWPLIELGQRRPVPFESFEDELNRSLELRVSARDIILRVEQNLFVGIAAVVFHRPTDVFEPEGIFRLSRDAPIDQRLVDVDADNARPRSWCPRPGRGATV